MVTSTIDPIRLPTITLSEAELQDIQDQIDSGLLPKDFMERHFEAVDENVFGVGFKRDQKGRPIEQGIGSSGNQTQQSIDAYRKWSKINGEDPAVIKANLERMEKELAASRSKFPSDPRERWLKQQRRA